MKFFTLSVTSHLTRPNFIGWKRLSGVDTCRTLTLFELFKKYRLLGDFEKRRLQWSILWGPFSTHISSNVRKSPWKLIHY